MPGEALAHNKELFHALIEHNPDAITLMTPNGTIIYANPASAQLTNYPVAQLEGMSSFALIYADDQRALKEQMTRLLEKKQDSFVLEYRLYCQDSSLKWVESTITNLLQHQQIGAIMCTSRDITERKQHFDKEQAAHLYAEQKFRSLVESHIVGVMVTDQEGKMYEVNDQLVKQLGYSREELLDGHIRVKDLVTPAFLGARTRAWKTLISQGASLPEEKEYRRKDGTCFPALVTAATINEERTRALVMLLDISDRKEAERRKQEFLGMVSHELRTPLTAIQGFLELSLLCAERYAKISGISEQSFRNRLQEALRQTEIETRLVAELLDVSRIEMQKFEVVLQHCNLITLVQQVVTNHQQIAPTCDIELLLPPQAEAMVEADPDRIEQVLSNLLTNALKYSASDKRIQVQLSLEELMVRVSICDQGPGLNREQQQRIWDRFYRVKDSPTRKSDGGLGLGLYIVRTIIAQHQGQVGVESSPGEGATFWFLLPRADEG